MVLLDPDRHDLVVQPAAFRFAAFSCRCTGSTPAVISLGTITPINEPIAR
jgi:hypothetical protein